MLTSNYSRLALPVVGWDDLETFLGRFDLEDAVHAIELPSGLRLELVLRGLQDIGDLAAVPLFFSGALPGREGTSPPYFSGDRLSTTLGMPWIAVSDPVLARSDDFALSWYTGLVGDAVQNAIALIADSIGGKLDREILFVGGSGGGFASLVSLALSKRPARALVWNPQWDIRKYVKESVQDYMTKGLGIPVELDSVHEAPEPGDLLWRVPKLGEDKTLVYLQNRGDWHVKDHLLGFLQEQDFQDRRAGVYGRSGLQVLLANFGIGHAVPPQALLHELLRLLVGPSISNVDVINAADRAGLWDHTAPPSLPRLSGLSQATASRGLGIELTRGGEGSRVDLSMPETYSNRGTPNDVLFNVSGRDAEGARVGTGPQRRPSICFPGRQVDNVYATARDGFGRLVCDGTAVPSGAGASSAADSGKMTQEGVFIIGSCVSRDAFNLPNGPSFADYVARTSFASAFSPVPEAAMPDLENNPSKFQQRMVHGDWNKTLEGKLRGYSGGVVLVDLIDERFSQIHVGGSVVTGSPELQRCDADLFRLERDAPGSEPHLAGFRQGFHRLVEIIDPARIVISKVFWARFGDDGDPLPNQQKIAEANAILRQLYDVVAEYPVHWIEYASDLMVASASHRWGIAPFHFAMPFYEATIAGIADVLDGVYEAR